MNETRWIGRGVALPATAWLVAALLSSWPATTALAQAEPADVPQPPASGSVENPQQNSPAPEKAADEPRAEGRKEAGDKSNTQADTRNQQPRLGVRVAQRQGLKITFVQPNTAAAEVGLEPGDEIVAVDERRVMTQPELVHQLDAAASAGGPVTLAYVHDDKLTEAKIQRELLFRAAPQQRRESYFRGSDAAPPPSPRLGVQLVLDEGLRISAVQSQSAAAEIGLQPGDEIIAVNDMRVVTRDQLSAQLDAAARAGGPVTIAYVHERELKQANVKHDALFRAAPQEERRESYYRAPAASPYVAAPLYYSYGGYYPYYTGYYPYYTGYGYWGGPVYGSRGWNGWYGCW